MRPWLLVSIPIFVLIAVLAINATGAFGPLQVCGADAAPICVAWPSLATWAIWLLFVGLIAAVAIWHAHISADQDDVRPS